MFIPYFDFDGNGKEALEFYQLAFNAEVVRKLLYKDMPVDLRFKIEDYQLDWLLNGELKINGHSILMSDTDNYTAGRNVKINISDSPEKLQNYWSILSENATNVYPLEKTFFSPLHGSLTDKFGVTWLFTAEVET